MKYSKLKEIINEKAFNLKESAAYSGSWTDGGSANLLSKLEKFKQQLVVKYDLRPSEYNQLENIDIGEPEEFSTIIEEYKIKIAEQIAKNIKL